MAHSMKITAKITSIIISALLILIFIPANRVYADDLYVEDFSYTINKEPAKSENYHANPEGTDKTHIPHWVGDPGFTVTNAENDAKLNALKGVILFSDFPRAYNFGIASYSGAWAGSTSTNILSLDATFLLSDGTTQTVNVPFKNTSNWKMYLEVTDKNGNYATFTPNNTGGTIWIPQTATSSTKNLLKLCGGSVTEQMKLGITDSSRSNAAKYNNKYGISYGKGTTWDDSYLNELNTYTTYFARDVEVEGVGKQTIVLKLDVVIDINCGGCLTYGVSDCMMANTYRVDVEKESENYNPDRDSSSVEIKATGGVSKTSVIDLDSDGAGKVTSMLYLDSAKDSYSCTIAETPQGKVVSSPEEGYTIDLKSRDIIKGVSDYKLWSASINGGEYSDYQTIKFTNKYPFDVYYKADDKGAITGIEAETVKAGTAVSGSQYTPNSGYAFDYWTCDKDVTLNDGATVIPAGDPITDKQLTSVIANDTMTFTAHFAKRPDPVPPVDPDDPDNPDNPDKAVKTGDSTNVFLLVDFMILAALGIAVASRKKIWSKAAADDRTGKRKK